jgi:hypothetical protein
MPPAMILTILKKQSPVSAIYAKIAEKSRN